MSVAICTDSSALFPAGIRERLGIIVVPVAITLEDAPFEEHDRALDDFYARLEEGAVATTSQPSPGVLLDAYVRAAAGGAEEVLSIHLDARVSGTVGSAELAAREGPIPVTVVDTRTVSYGVGVCVRKAAAAIAAGSSSAEAAEAATAVGATLRNVFVAPGGGPGRVPGGAGWAVLEWLDGATRVAGACDDVGEAIGAMVSRASSERRPVRVAVGHAGAATEPPADALAQALARLPQVTEVERYRVGAAVGAHTGPLSFGAFWWPSS